MDCHKAMRYDTIHIHKCTKTVIIRLTKVLHTLRSVESCFPFWRVLRPIWPVSGEKIFQGCVSICRDSLVSQNGLAEQRNHGLASTIETTWVFHSVLERGESVPKRFKKRESFSVIIKFQKEFIEFWSRLKESWKSSEQEEWVIKRFKEVWPLAESYTGLWDVDTLTCLISRSCQNKNKFTRPVGKHFLFLCWAKHDFAITERTNSKALVNAWEFYYFDILWGVANGHFCYTAPRM